MNDIAISVDGLSKKYRLGAHLDGYKTLREALVKAIKKPLQSARNKPTARDNDTALWALKDVSFDVRQGEVLGIIGRNGAGKTTLLKVLSQITEPTTGRAKIYGRIGSLLEVGTGFHPELSGRENIYLNGAIIGMKRAEIDRKFDEIVAFAEIEKFLDTPVKRYSSGMYVRLAFAVAAHLEPEILVVDEVLAVGDAAFQQKCLGKMEDVAKTGRTVLFVSHNLAAVQSLCTEALFLEEGFAVSKGNVHKVIGEYIQKVTPQSANQSIDLKLLPRDRRLKAIFAEGRLNNKNLAGHHYFQPEETLSLKLVLDLESAYRQCTIGIHFDNHMGARVLAVNTRWAMKPIDLGMGLKKIECLINDMPLVPGRYYISIGFSASGEQIDWLERIACLEIADYDVYGTGELPWVDQGYFLAHPHWSISELNNTVPVTDE